MSERLEYWKGQAAAWEGSGGDVSYPYHALAELADLAGVDPPEKLSGVMSVPARGICEAVARAIARAAEPGPTPPAPSEPTSTDPASSAASTPVVEPPQPEPPQPEPATTAADNVAAEPEPTLPEPPLPEPTPEPLPEAEVPQEPEPEPTPPKATKRK